MGPGNRAHGHAPLATHGPSDFALWSSGSGGSLPVEEAEPAEILELEREHQTCLPGKLSGALRRGSAARWPRRRGRAGGQDIHPI
jgi:hypothetical protein